MINKFANSTYVILLCGEATPNIHSFPLALKEASACSVAVVFPLHSIAKSNSSELYFCFSSVGSKHSKPVPLIQI